MGMDISRYLTFHNSGKFNIGCNVNTTIVKQSTYSTGSLLNFVYVKGEGELSRADVAPIYFSEPAMVSSNIPP